MRSFQVACIALATASASALTSGLGAAYYGSAYALGGPSYTTGYTQAPATISYAAAAPASYGIAPASYGIAAAAPISYAIATPAKTAQISYGLAAPAAGPVYQIAPTGPTYSQIAASTGPVQANSHEIHTTSGRQAIRIEEVQAGDQIIRVVEQPQAGPQVSQIQVPGEQHHVRVINHQSGPAEVQRVVQRQQTQVFDVQKPGRAGARIVQVVRGESPAPTVEFVNAGGSNHYVYQANEIASAAGPVASYATGPITATYSGLGSSAYGSSYALPAYTTSYSSGSSYQTLPSTIGYSSGSSYQTLPSTIAYSGSIGSSSGSGSYGSTAVISKA